MLDPLLLKTFVAIVDNGGFSRAADRLSLTPSAISGHLRRLEDQVGKTLLRRTTRTRLLTPDGERLLPYARAILLLGRDAVSGMAARYVPALVRIGVSEEFAEPALLQVLADIGRRYPQVTVVVECGMPVRLLGALNHGALELVLGSSCKADAPGQLLWREPLVWAWSCGHELPRAGVLPLAVFPHPCQYHEAALASLSRAGRRPYAAIHCTSIHALRAAAMAGFAVAPMPLSQLGAELRSLAEDEGLPSLPDVEFRLLKTDALAGDLGDALVHAIVAHYATRIAPQR